MERLKNFRVLMGGGASKEQLTDEEYLDYLEGSNSLCGRLWANLNANQDQDQESAGSIFSISDLFESILDAEEEDRDVLRERTEGSSARESSESSTTTAEPSIDDPLLFFSEFVADDVLSSTFIIDEDPDFSQDQFFDLDDSGDYGRRIIIQDHLRMTIGECTTNPCA